MIRAGTPGNKDIPSIKDFWHKNLYPEIPQEIIDKVYNLEDVIKYLKKDYGYSLNKDLTFKWDRNGYTFDGNVAWLIPVTCWESQFVCV